MSKELTLSEEDLDALLYHYTGNCFSCPRCTFYERISKGEPGAVAKYIAYMKKEHGRTITAVPASDEP